MVGEKQLPWVVFCRYSVRRRQRSGAVGSAGTGPAIVICEAGAYAAYMTSVATIVQLYHARIQLCELQGHY